MKKSIAIFGGAFILIVALLIAATVHTMRAQMRTLEEGLRSPKVEDALARVMTGVVHQPRQPEKK